MSEKDDKLNKGSFLYINDEEKAEWGYPEGYPYKEIKISDTLTWDGNTDGLVSVEGSFYKVSDAVPILSDFSNGVSVISTNISDLTEKEVQIPADLIGEPTPGIVMIAEGEVGFCVSSEGVGIDIDKGVFFDEPGTYLPKNQLNFVSSLTIPGYTGFTKTEIHTMVPEFLPADVLPAGGSTFIVNVAMDEQDNYVADKTYAEISEALANGQMPYCIYGTLVFHIMLSSALLNTYQAGNSHNFLCIAANLTIFQIEITDNGNVSLIQCGKITTTT